MSFQRSKGGVVSLRNIIIVLVILVALGQYAILKEDLQNREYEIESLLDEIEFWKQECALSEGIPIVNTPQPIYN
jgi:hypothetical protein